MLEHLGRVRVRVRVGVRVMTETKEAPVTRTVVLPRCGPLVGERLCTATGAKDVTLSGCSWKFW